MLFDKNESQTTTCPTCGWTGPALGEPEDLIPEISYPSMLPMPTLQLLGCCEGFVMCPYCATEWNPETGVLHDESCEECNENGTLYLFE